MRKIYPLYPHLWQSLLSSTPVFSRSPPVFVLFALWCLKVVGQHGEESSHQARPVAKRGNLSAHDVLYFPLPRPLSAVHGAGPQSEEEEVGVYLRLGFQVKHQSWHIVSAPYETLLLLYAIAPAGIIRVTETAQKPNKSSLART